jgi:hypothetical protein
MSALPPKADIERTVPSRAIRPSVNLMVRAKLFRKRNAKLFTPLGWIQFTTGYQLEETKRA